jgi:hypothetical protein
MVLAIIPGLESCRYVRGKNNSLPSSQKGDLERLGSIDEIVHSSLLNPMAHMKTCV